VNVAVGIPPRAAYNEEQVLLATSDEWGSASEYQRDGRGGHVLCARWNNNTGGWYGRAFVDEIAHDAVRNDLISRCPATHQSDVIAANTTAWSGIEWYHGPAIGDDQQIDHMDDIVYTSSSKRSTTTACAVVPHNEDSSMATKNAAPVKIGPLADRVVVRSLEDAGQTRGGLFIPDTAKEKPQHGEILAIGPGRFDEGARIPMDVKVGDKVLFGKYSGTEVVIDGESLLILRESDVLAVLQ